MELADYFRILRQRWLMVVVLTVVGCALAAAVTLVQRPAYETSAEVFVSTQSTDGSTSIQQGNNYTLQRVKTYAHLTTTEVVLQPVIDELGLDLTAAELASRVTATAVVDTTIVEITVTDSDPEQAALLANTVAATLATVVEEIEPSQGESDTSLVQLTVAQTAPVPSVPVNPKVWVNLALGLLVGAAAGVGAAVLREVLDTRIRSRRDVAAVTDHPLLGGIVLDPRAHERPLLLHIAPTSPVAESFRSLRTNLQFVDVDGGSRSFAITSSVPNEGKSTTAVNLALALADAGQTVILVDADLRRPKAAAYMGLEGGVGLTDVLINRIELEDAVQQWGRDGVYVLPSGQVPPNPSELLGSQAMEHLVASLESEFDWVIFDAPPLLPVTDSVVLVKQLAGALVAVAAGRTTRHQLDMAVQTLDNVGARVAGIVLTMVPKANTAYGYGYTPAVEDADATPRRQSSGASQPSVAPTQTDDVDTSAAVGA